MDSEFQKEVAALAKVIDDLDYYQILKVKENAFNQEIKRAYFKQSRIYHPDKYYTESPEFQKQVNKIFKRIAEAYKILSDEDKRALYTKAVKGPDRKKFLRYNKKLLEQSAREKEDEGQTQMGRKYYQLAKTAMNNRDYNSAKINLQLASKMEPANETFKKRLEEVEAMLKQARKNKPPV